MDALVAVIDLLKPHAVGAKIIHGAGPWSVRYPAFEQPSFALMLQGRCWLAVDGMPAMTLEAGDFVLFPSIPGFTMASDAGVSPKSVTPAAYEPADEVFHGDATSEPTVTMVGGYFAFDPVNASILLEFLPRVVRIRPTDPAISNVGSVIELIQREARDKRAGQSLVLSRLIEIMLVESLRTVSPDMTATGLLAGLQDPQLVAALSAIHTKTAHPWTVATLAREAGMSRSAFAERFAKVIGTTPLNYLLRWRLAVAKDMLAGKHKSVSETAVAIGYDSASAFSTAFSRETGSSPKEFIRSHRSEHAGLRA